jgi:hypothetical protein
MGWQILGADGVTVLAVDSTSNAARTTLYDQNGNPMCTTATVGTVLNALSAAVTITLGGQSTVSFNVESTAGTITLSFEATIDGTDWFSILANPVAGGGSVASTTDDGQWTTAAAGFTKVRARVSAITGAASMSVSVVATPGESQVGLSPNFPLPAGTNSIGTVTSQLASQSQTNYYPAPSSPGPAQPINSDPSGSLEIRGPVTTDELGVRDCFVGNSISTALTGTCTFVNGSVNVVGVGTLFQTQVYQGQYVKLSADSETAYAQVSEVISNTSLTLVTAYTGSSTTAATVVSNWATSTGTGTITVSSGTLAITTGTTLGATTRIQKVTDYAPIQNIIVASFTPGTGTAQAAFFGLQDNPASPTQQLTVEFDNSLSANQIRIITSDSTGVSQQLSQVVTLPYGLLNTQTLQYKVSLTQTSATVEVSVPNVGLTTVVFNSQTRIPLPYVVMSAVAGVTNSGAITSSGTLTLSTYYINNQDRLEVALSFTGEPIQVYPVPDQQPSLLNITAQDVGSTTTAVAYGQSFVTGTPTAGSTAVFTSPSTDTVKILVTGTWTGTLVVEKSMDGGTTWVAGSFHVVGTNYFVSSFTANIMAGMNCTGTGYIRLRATTAWTGTATVKIITTGNVNVVYQGGAVRVCDGTTQSTLITVKAGSTPSVAGDTSQVVALSPNSPLYDNFGNPVQVKNRVSMPATQGVSPVSGLARGVLNRVHRVGDQGTVRTTSESLLWNDPLEGTTINAFWTQSTLTQTIAQTAGVLTLNNSGIATASTYAIITSQRQFPNYPGTQLVERWRVNLSGNAASNHTLAEWGFGSVTTTTASVTNGAFFRQAASGALQAILSFGSTEQTAVQLLAQGVISTTEYYNTIIIVQDDFVRFVVVDSSGVPIVDQQVPVTNTIAAIWSTSHVPTFARVYCDATGGGTVVKLNIAANAIHQLDGMMNLPWAHQMAACMRPAIISPTAYTKTTALLNSAPAGGTPSNGASLYTTLGGEFIATMTAASENLLALFSYAVPSPYTFFLTGITIPPPIVSTVFSITTAAAIEFFVYVNNTAAFLSSITGQGQSLGMFSASTTAAVGTIMSGVQLQWQPQTPLPCLPGLNIIIGWKSILTGTVTTGAIRGSVQVDGYFN